MFEDLSKRHAKDAIGRLANINLIDLRISEGQSTEVEAELEAVAGGDRRRFRSTRRSTSSVNSRMRNNSPRRRASITSA